MMSSWMYSLPRGRTDAQKMTVADWAAQLRCADANAIARWLGAQPHDVIQPMPIAFFCREADRAWCAGMREDERCTNQTFDAWEK